MKLITATVKKLASIFLVVEMMVCALPMANAGEAANFIGKKRPAIVGETGYVIKEKKTRASASSNVISKKKDLAAGIITTKLGLVFLLEESHTDENGNIDSWLVKDAIDIPKGMVISGGPIEDPCTAKSYPHDFILALGKWVDKKSKDGGYAGGYLHPITKAWRVDFDEQKLKEIPKVGVKCEDNRTEADF